MKASTRTAAALTGSLAILSLAACGQSSPPAATPPPVTVTATATATAQPATPTPTPTPTPASPTPAASASATTFTMPKLVGQNLQLAQDILQKHGSYLMDQEDAMGLDRFQVNDSNWKVCSQSPKAGAKTDVSTVTVLSSVKLSEECP